MDCARPSPSNAERCRLQKYLARCGLGSRRACEDLIAAGVVAVNGQVVTEPGTRVEPGRDVVTCRGNPVSPEPIRLLLLHKPPGVLCTVTDPWGRRTFRDLFSNLQERVYTVGRLDRDSEGAILVTNDGDLAHRLMHPRHHVTKEYCVWVDRPFDAEALAHMLKGVQSKGEWLRAESVELDPDDPGEGRLWRMRLAEGRNRQIRRMVGGCGRVVQRLVRVAIGPLALGSLPVGEARELTHAEREALHRAGEAR